MSQKMINAYYHMVSSMTQKGSSAFGINHKLYQTCSETAEALPDLSFLCHALPISLEIHTVFLRKIDFA